MNPDHDSMSFVYKPLELCFYSDQTMCYGGVLTSVINTTFLFLTIFCQFYSTMFMHLHCAGVCC